MRILHTSDWHLGASSDATSRGPDHDLFLAWLEGKLAELEVDVLVIAGDVFDSMQPSADAQARYYRFLGRVGASGLRQVVIVGGNHDSASRLDAPSEVLEALDMRVVGGIGGSAASRERCLVPLRDRSGQIAAVALAVPYVHEFRLGVRTTDLDRHAVRADFTARFTALYAGLADLARQRWPGLPIVATGHLTLGVSRREDQPYEIHLIGQLEGLPPSVLDPRLQYVALGHIHRPYPVLDRRAWYSGSPVALSLPEAAMPRRVLVVDLDPEPEGLATVEPLEVPTFRALRELRAPPADLVAQVRALRWDEPLPPLLFCRVISDQHEPLLKGQLHEALASFPENGRPALVELFEVRATPHGKGEPEQANLHDLSPPEVFATLCRARGVAQADSLTQAFEVIVGISGEDINEMVSKIREGRS